MRPDCELRRDTIDAQSRFRRRRVAFVSAQKIRLPGNRDFGSKRRGSNAGQGVSKAKPLGMVDQERHFFISLGEVERPVDRQAHNLKVVGSAP
jgi:hypothetical protein